MNALAMAGRFGAGILLGIVFYGGLWLSLRRLAGSAHPAAWAIGSFWIRTLVVLAGFLLVTERRWEYALLCLAGFTLARFAVQSCLSRREARPKCT